MNNTTTNNSSQTVNSKQPLQVVDWKIIKAGKKHYLNGKTLNDGEVLESIDEIDTEGLLCSRIKDGVRFKLVGPVGEKVTQLAAMALMGAPRSLLKMPKLPDGPETKMDIHLLRFIEQAERMAAILEDEALCLVGSTELHKRFKVAVTELCDALYEAIYSCKRSLPSSTIGLASA